jgi:hypothetical protein
MRIWGSDRLSWKDRKLYAQGQRVPIASIESDSKWPNMWRVRLPNGKLSDMANLARAKDAARIAALAILNAQERRSGSGKAHFGEEGGEWTAKVARWPRPSLWPRRPALDPNDRPLEGPR